MYNSPGCGDVDLGKIENACIVVLDVGSFIFTKLVPIEAIRSQKGSKNACIVALKVGTFMESS